MGVLKIPEFKQYILRKLGHPVIRVEIDDTQMDDCIDEALKTFAESHYDACDIGYHPVDVVQGTANYTLPETIQDVMEVLNIEGQNGSGVIGSIDPGDPFMWPWSGSRYGDVDDYWDVVSVEVWRQRWALWEDTWTTPIPFDFNSISKKLYLHDPPNASGIRMLKVVQVADADSNFIIDSLWLKKYSVALARIQWGVNLGKYEGAQLPGGVSINAAGILEKGETDKENLLTELDEKYTEPPDPVFA